MKSGIYKIRNVWTGDVYIGSAKSFVTRWHRHRKDLRKGKHHSQYLQRSWDKYGETSFVFGIIEYTDDLCDRENYYLRLERPVYNMCPEAYSQIGRKLSDAHVAAIIKYVRDNNIRPPESTWKLKQKPVDMLTLQGEYVQTFESVSAACRAVGKDSTFSTTISAVCMGGKRRLSAFGYKWRWKMFPNENQSDSRVKH